MSSPSVPRAETSRSRSRTGVRKTLASSVLIISTGAGSVTPEVEKQLRTAFYGDLILDFNPKDDFRKLITPDARVAVAGGDGTIGFVARALIDSRNTLGIISLGTYNNFAKSLGLPASLNSAINIVKTGVPRPITVGRVNGTPFLEAAAIGMFGAAIELGEAVKDGAFGTLGRKLALVTGAKPFRYEITGDIQGHGRALSLVFANTPSIGASMPVASATPIDHYLELSVHAGASRRDIIGRLLSGRMTTPREDPLEMGFRFKKITITTKPMIEIFADNIKVGQTPATITAETGALSIILPKRLRPPRR